MTKIKRNFPASPCTACGYICDMASCVTDDDARIPAPGDISVCLKCGHMMGFTKDLKLRDLNDEEMLRAAGDPVIVKLQELRGEFMKKMD
jgi:Na+-translocating ferredoxin:NAD+ oxidoreductase RNF subunit RnfB